MKKIVVGIVFVLVIAGVGAPFVIGLVMERIIQQSYRDLNKMYGDTGSGVSVEIIKYERNFSSSEIEWKIKFASMKPLKGIEEIILIDRADHGLTGIVSRTSLEKNQWFIDLVNDKLGGKNPLSITTEFMLSGKIESTVTLDAFAFKVDDDVFEVRPGSVITACDTKFTNFFSEAFWEGISVPDKFNVDGVSWNYNLGMISTYIWDGNLSLVVENSKVEGDNGLLELENLKSDYTLDFDKEENTLSIGVAVAVDSLRAVAEKLENGSVWFGVNSIDAGGYNEFMKLYSEMIHRVLSDISAAEDDPERMKTIIQEQMAARGFQMVAAFEKIMKKGLEIQVSNLKAKLPLGEIKGDVTLRLNRDMTFAQFVPIVNRPALAVGIFSLQSEVSFPLDLAGDNSMLLSPVYPGMKTGLFVKNGESLEHKAETRDGKLFLNGQEVLFN